MLVLWIILGIIIVSTIVFTVVIGLPQDVNRGPSQQIPCTKPLNQLPEVTDTTRFEPCFNIGTNIQGQGYYDKVNDWTVLPLDRPVIPPAEQVCIEFCTQTQLPSECVTQTKEYADCIQKLSPETTGCTDPAQPVSRKGSRNYYAIGKGKVSCYEAN